MSYFFFFEKACFDGYFAAVSVELSVVHRTPARSRAIPSSLSNRTPSIPYKYHNLSPRFSYQDTVSFPLQMITLVSSGLGEMSSFSGLTTFGLYLVDVTGGMFLHTC